MGAAPSPMRSTLFDLRLLVSFVSHTSSHLRHTYSLHVIQHLAFHRVLYASNNDNSSSSNSASSSSSYALNNVMHTRTQQ
jgi:Ni,Fe-hydrogenase I large subunit